MKKLTIITYLFLLSFAGSLFANEVNIFSARHYDSDVQLYEKFTAKTGIKVNVVSGKSGALEKRIIEEGADSKADLYIIILIFFSWTNNKFYIRSKIRA